MCSLGLIVLALHRGGSGANDDDDDDDDDRVDVKL
jgi:hypothetical protein